MVQGNQHLHISIAWGELTGFIQSIQMRKRNLEQAGEYLMESDNEVKLYTYTANYGVYGAEVVIASCVEEARKLMCHVYYTNETDVEQRELKIGVVSCNEGDA